MFLEEDKLNFLSFVFEKKCWMFLLLKFFLKKIILSYLAGRDGRLDTLNSRIHPLFEILETEL